MSATVILGPSAAADAVAHDEQLLIWADDLIGILSMENFLRDDLDYAEGVDLQCVVKRELKRIIESAFDHPEARTIKRVR